MVDRLIIIYDPGHNQGPPSNYGLGSIPQSQPSGSMTATIPVPNNNPSPTTYTVYAVLWATGTTTELARSSPTQITVSYKKFNIIQLSMTGDDLWPNFSPNYYGSQQRDAAFGDVNTIINVISTTPNLSNTYMPDGSPLMLSTLNQIKTWAIWNAYGNPPTNINLKRTILCGIDDFTGGFLPNPAHMGFTMYEPMHTVPSISFVLYSKIRNVFTGYDQTRVIVGATIHELGHAIGIVGDGPQLTHTGNHVSDCVMNSGLGPSSFTDIYFCTGHLNNISTYNWFIE